MANGDGGQQGGEGGQEGGQGASGHSGITGFKEAPERDTGPTIEDTLRDLGAGEDVTATEEPTPEGGQEPAGQEPAGQEPATEESPEGGEEPSPEGGQLPEGFTDEGDRVRGPDGRFYAREDVLEQGADADPLPTEEEAEEFFEGEGEEPEHSVEIELEAEEGAEPDVLEIATDDPEVAEQIEQMQADAREARQLRAEIAEIEETRAEVQRDLQEAELLEEEIRMDPTGFVVERLPEDRRVEVAEELLLESDEVLEAVQEKLNEWSRDPVTRREERLDRREARDQRRKELESRREKARAAAETGQTVAQALQSTIPEDMSANRAQMFLRDAVRDIQDYCQENNLGPRDLTVELVPQIIEERLQVYGVTWNPESTTEDGRRSSDLRTAQPGGEEEADLASRAEEARKTGERLRKAYARRKQAGQSAPAGQGSPGTRSKPPSDATLDEALESMRQRVAG